jgi:periplasmic protein CpxP/Spy
MVDQSDTKPSNPDQTASPRQRNGRRGTFLIALLAVAVLAGLGGSMLSSAFGQGASWHRISWHSGGMFGGPLTPAQIDDRIDRMTKHMAIELDATQDQQVKLANIAKAAVADLRPLKEKAQGARAQAVTHPPSIVLQSSVCAPSSSGSRRPRANASRRRWPMPPKC